MKNILLLTDFSPVANNAAQYALKLAAALKGKLILFHAFNVPQEALLSTVVGDAEEGYELAEKESVAKLHALAKQLKKEIEETGKYIPAISCLTQEGKIKDCIASTVKEQKTDLIIVGAHQYINFADFLFGNDVSGVIDEASCPVLIIPDGTLFKHIKSIFYATDLRYCDIGTVNLLTEFARPFNARVSLFHVCTEGLPDLLNDEAVSIFLDTVASRINYPPLSYKSISGKDAESAINQIIKNQEMNILAMAHRKYHFFKKIFKGSITKNMAAYTTIPLMIIPVS